MNKLTLAILLMITVISIITVSFHSLILNTVSVEKLLEPENSRMETLVIHEKAYSNYTYEPDSKDNDSWDVYDINYKFSGDCEDFAFSMQQAVGAGSVYGVLLKKHKEGVPVNHMVFIYAGIVWELNGKYYSIYQYESLGHKILFYNGDTTPEIR